MRIENTWCMYRCPQYHQMHHRVKKWRARAVRDRNETHTVEGGNADLPHYVARLVRTSRKSADQ